MDSSKKSKSKSEKSMIKSKKIKVQRKWNRKKSRFRSRSKKSMSKNVDPKLQSQEKVHTIKFKVQKSTVQKLKFEKKFIVQKKLGLKIQGPKNQSKI